MCIRGKTPGENCRFHFASARWRQKCRDRVRESRGKSLTRSTMHLRDTRPLFFQLRPHAHRQQHTQTQHFSRQRDATVASGGFGSKAIGATASPLHADTGERITFGRFTACLSPTSHTAELENKPSTQPGPCGRVVHLGGRRPTSRTVLQQL